MKIAKEKANSLVQIGVWLKSIHTSVGTMSELEDWVKEQRALGATHFVPYFLPDNTFEFIAYEEKK